MRLIAALAWFATAAGAAAAWLAATRRTEQVGRRHVGVPALDDGELREANRAYWALVVAQARALDRVLHDQTVGLLLSEDDRTAIEQLQRRYDQLIEGRLP